MNPEPKNRGGRPRVPEAEKLKETTFRLNDAQREKVVALGRDAWIRRMIDKAKLPSP